MNIADLLRLFRSEVRDEARPYLWSDDEVFVYMTEAQAMFCRLTGGIPDATMTAVSPAGGGYFPLPKELMKLKSVQIPSEQRPLSILNHEDLQYRTEFTAWQRTPPGAPAAIVVGDLDGHAALYPPNAAQLELRLIGYRLPREPITGLNSELEIRDEHHYSLLLWIKHLAHLKQDAETFDRGRSEDFSRQFVEYCSLAKGEQERRDHKPRTIAYGGL